MKKIVSIIALCFLISTRGITAIASSIVNLSSTGNVLPSTSLNVLLNGLVPSVTYSVVCYIDTTYSFQYVMLSSYFSDITSTILSYSLNGNYIRQDQLIVGHNIVVIEGNFTSPSSSYLIITNLDQTNAFNVNGCFAIPVQV